MLFFQMYSDSWFLAGVDKIAKLLIANNVRTYMYVLNYTLQGLALPDWYGKYELATELVSF